MSQHNRRVSTSGCKGIWSLAENQKRKCARTALYFGKKLSVGEKNESV